ncbi:MAG TPA: histidine phosphotransferase family protein [Rhodopila sp.]
MSGTLGGLRLIELTSARLYHDVIGPDATDPAGSLAQALVDPDPGEPAGPGAPAGAARPYATDGDAPEAGSAGMRPARGDAPAGHAPPGHAPTGHAPTGHALPGHAPMADVPSGDATTGDLTGRGTAGASAPRAAATPLQALRHAAWTPGTEPMPLVRLRELGDGLPRRVNLDTAALSPDTAFPAATSRIVLNLLLLAADSLPAGGSIIVAGTPDDLFVQIAGPDAAWPRGMVACLTDEAALRSALAEGRNLQMALAALLAHAAGIRLSVLIPPNAQNRPAIIRLGG